MPPSVLIIGGGIAGLAAGCFSRMSGFPTEVIEMHSVPGGLCTAWTRKGYTADLCIHWLTGSDPTSPLSAVYRDIGLLHGQEIVKHEYYTRVMDSDGHVLTLYNNPDRLYSELVSFSTGDEPFARSLCNDIRRLAKMQLSADMGIMQMIRFIPLLPVMKRYKAPLAEVLSVVKDPELRSLLLAGLDWHGQSAVFSLMGLALQGSGNGGYPMGGSLPLAQGVEKRFLELGGSIRYRSRVESIITEQDRAAGVRLSDGTEVRADIVISAADGHATIYDWLGGKYLDDTIRACYENFRPFPPLVFVTLGIGADLGSRPHNLVCVLKDPLMVGGVLQNDLTIHNHSYDRTLAPPGKSVITLSIPSEWGYWQDKPRGTEAYEHEKQSIADQVTAFVTTTYPECSERVEMTDVATPHTFFRYTGNWKGSYEGWLLTADSFFTQMPMILPGLSGFYMAGQWVKVGGGIPGAVLSARDAVKRVCKDTGHPFLGRCKA
jgi:phytoene dehydrogenase-like protein